MTLWGQDGNLREQDLMDFGSDLDHEKKKADELNSGHYRTCSVDVFEGYGKIKKTVSYNRKSWMTGN
jgi:hypothetical protein